jgi:hypothetical protein
LETRRHSCQKRRAASDKPDSSKGVRGGAARPSRAAAWSATAVAGRGLVVHQVVDLARAGLEDRGLQRRGDVVHVHPAEHLAGLVHHLLGKAV